MRMKMKPCQSHFTLGRTKMDKLLIMRVSTLACRMSSILQASRWQREAVENNQNWARVNCANHSNQVCESKLSQYRSQIRRQNKSKHPTLSVHLFRPKNKLKQAKYHHNKQSWRLTNHIIHISNSSKWRIISNLSISQRRS